MRKQKQGKFEAIEDILELDGFGVKVLERFCDSILAAKKEEEVEKHDDELTEVPVAGKRKQTFVQPALLELNRMGISSCVSFHLDLNYIAWSKLSIGSRTDGQKVQPIHVENWTCFEIGNDDKKLSLSDLIQILVFLNDQIPHADCYVVEAQQSAQAAKQPGSPVQVNINVQKSQFMAMLSVLMVARDKHSLIDGSQTQEFLDLEDAKANLKQQQKMFFLRTFLASRLYKTFVGNERVSTENVIESILRYNYSKDQPTNLTFSSIDVPMDLREHYDHSNKLDREYMGQALLVGLSFLKLCVLKCNWSINHLNKRAVTKTVE